MSVTPSAIVGASLRYKVDPRDVPPAKAARRLHLTLTEFRAKLPDLLRRGFPPPDPTTGNFDLVAIDRWMDTRSGPGPLTEAPKLMNASSVFAERARQLDGQ